MKTLLLGYIDNNLGDDLIIQGICKEFPRIQFYTYVSSAIFKETFKDIPNLHVRVGNVYKCDLSEFDKCIKVGGSMYIMQNSLHYKYRLREILFSRKLKKSEIESAVIGSNYGPFKNKMGIFLIKQELKHKKLITVRDKYSFEILKSFKFSKKIAIDVFDDVVYASKLNESSQKKNICGISVYNSASIKDKAKYYKNLAYMCDTLIERGFETIRLFSFDCESENDLIACHYIKSWVKDTSKVEIVAYLGTVDDFLFKFSECEKIVAIRFHSAVLSDMFQIPFIPISYSNKMLNFLKDKEYTNNLYTLEDIQSLDKTEQICDDICSEKLFTNFTKSSDAFQHIRLLNDFFE